MSPHSAEPRTGLLPGIAAGLAAALVGAVAYGALIAITMYDLGIAAVGIGLLVGLAMMAVKPTSPVLPALAALFSLIACALGQIGGMAAAFSGVIAGGNTVVGFVDSFGQVAGAFPELVGEDPLTLLFWALSAFAGYSFVNKRVKAAPAAQQQPAEQPRGAFEAPAPPPGPAQQPGPYGGAYGQPFPGTPQTPGGDTQPGHGKP
jgi:hypothetical protein